MLTVHRHAIKSAEDFHHHDPRWGRRVSAAEGIVLLHSGGPLADKFDVDRLPRSVSTKATAYARVDLGRWIVDCQFCNSAQHASRADRRFFCVECMHAEAGGQWINVLWPADEMVAQIEELLGKRPSVGNMWWTPGESLARLHAENEEHGVI